ncbi:MAG TPA: reverse transcriptase domain-containing protein [Ruminococcus sp.]|jgi:group II intron reverse transcriptase/maturase|nr:reverse transcriptase domain-containing protein [Ruminococcus sp.]HRU78572.1 reverse transcriptase domain-containing protein [Rectinema sp.]
MKPTTEILERIRKSSADHKDGVFTRLYRYLLRDDVYKMAYKNIYANQGAATKGTDNDTADSFSQEYIDKIIMELSSGTYEPKPVRRTYREKKNGKLRPLGIPSFKDKIVQDIIRMYLEAIYEPIFSDRSHGFRPGRSCHTALTQITKGFNGIKWFIEGDIKGCFDNIDHDVLLSILTRKIKDSKFINLIRKFLKAGYMEEWKYHATYSGTPQGGILSPILANIYLNELDMKIDEIRKAFDKPAKRSSTHEYSAKKWQIEKVIKAIKACTNADEKALLITELKKLRKELCQIPAKDQSDKKIVYVRYADDFLIGVNGTKEECQQIKSLLKEYLTEHLRLELSDEKTKITHSSDCARFLGYYVRVRRNNQLKKRSDGVIQRTLNLSVELLVPLKDKIERFMLDNKIAIIDKDGKFKPMHRNALVNNTDLEIVDNYNAQTRGICNYYSMASNFGRLDYFVYLMEYSCLKTLARKHQRSIGQMIDKYRYGKTWAIPYETKSGKKYMPIVRFTDMRAKRKSRYSHDIDKIVNPHYGFNELDKRISAKKCEICGAENIAFEIHHINKLKNLKGKELWEKVMISRKRKTLVVCKKCHYKIHGRTFDA